MAPPARVHPDLCRLWLGFVPWPRRGRQGNVACAGPTRLSGPGAAGGCRLWCGVLSPHGLPECALSLLDLFAPPGQCSVATAPHPARDADGQAPGHRRAAARRTGHPERLRCRPGSCDRCGTGARKGAALGGRAGAAPFSVLRARSLSEVFSREGGRSVTTSVAHPAAPRGAPAWAGSVLGAGVQAKPRLALPGYARGLTHESLGRRSPCLPRAASGTGCPRCVHT